MLASWWTLWVFRISWNTLHDLRNTGSAFAILNDILLCVFVGPTGFYRWGMCGRVQWCGRAGWEWETGGDASVHWSSVVMHTHYPRYVHRHTHKGVRRGKHKGLICRVGRWGESMRESFVSLVGPQTGWSRGGASGGWRPEFRTGTREPHHLLAKQVLYNHLETTHSLRP